MGKLDIKRIKLSFRMDLKLKDSAMTARPKHIEALFEFLKVNHDHNKKIQEDDIKITLDSCQSVERRALLLLHKIVNTQSQPKLHLSAQFFQSVEKASGCLKKFSAFKAFLRSNGKANSSMDFFEALNSQHGWGKKTSALFIRNLALIDANPALSNLFWEDIEKLKAEPIRLPVDKVILATFARMFPGENGTKSAFESFVAINKYLRQTREFDNAQMLIWDDLWFWGFITQTSKSKGTPPPPTVRSHEWNLEKYWSIFTASKDEATVREIRILAEEFLDLTAPASLGLA